MKSKKLKLLIAIGLNKSEIIPIIRNKLISLKIIKYLKQHESKHNNINMFRILLALLLSFPMQSVWSFGLDEMGLAILHGDKAKTEALIASGYDIQGNKGTRALYTAAESGKFEIAQMLVGLGVDVKSKEAENGFTALHVAVAAAAGALDLVTLSNKEKIATLLLSKGADVNAKNIGGITPLHMASTKALAQILIAKGANINAKDMSGTTPLFHKNIELSEFLIAHGADVNARNDSGITPLFSDEPEVVKLLVKHGADVNITTNNSVTRLDIAVAKNNSDLVAFLLAKGAQLKVKPELGLSELHLAASKGNKQMVEQLLTKAIQIDARDTYGRTPLFLAVERYHTDIAKLLILRGADINYKIFNDKPLVHQIRDKEMMKFFLDNGANVTTKDREGNALLGAISSNLELIRLVISRGADVNIANFRGNTLLHISTFEGYDDITKFLLTQKVNVNARNDFGQTPLFSAISFQAKLQIPNKRANPMRASGGERELATVALSNPMVASAPSTEIIKLLLAKGAKENSFDQRGQLPLHIAPNQEIAELFLARGAAVDAQRSDGATALHLAAVYARKDVVNALLAHRANVNAKTKDGVTPLHYANGLDVVKLLIDNGANIDGADSSGNTPLFMADEPNVVEALLSKGASLNIKNRIGQTPLLKIIRTYIENLPAHGLMHGPLGDPVVVAHGGNIKVINSLLESGADVNLADGDGCMPLFYVRAAKNNRAYKEVLQQLIDVEKALVKHGAKLEKIEK